MLSDHPAAPCEISSATIDRWRVSAALSGWSACVWADSDAAVDQGHLAGHPADNVTVAADGYTYTMDGAGPFDDTIFTDFGACSAGPLLSSAGKDSRGQHHAIQVGDKVRPRWYNLKLISEYKRALVFWFDL